MPVPTREEFAATAEKARQAGRQSAWKIYEDLRSQGYDSPPNLLGGFVYLHFLIDGRSKLARFFRSIEKDPLPNIKVWLLSQDRKSSEQFTGFNRGYHEMKA